MKTLGSDRVSLAHLFGQLNRIMTVCPNPECDGLFYLSEANPHLSVRQDQTIIDRIRAEEFKLDKQEEQLALAESALRGKGGQVGSTRRKTSSQDH
jgi:hypothetical protein